MTFLELQKLQSHLKEAKEKGLILDITGHHDKPLYYQRVIIAPGVSVDNIIRLCKYLMERNCTVDWKEVKLHELDNDIKAALELEIQYNDFYSTVYSAERSKNGLGIEKGLQYPIIKLSR